MAGADEQFKLLLTLGDAPGPARQGVPPTLLHLSFGPQHGRHPHATLDAEIEDRWERAVEANPRIFDGSKFRLARLGWAADGSGSVEMELGLTGYREYLGTNRLPYELRQQLEDDGERQHGDRNAHLSNALGCEALLVTADHQAVMLQRSGAVSTHSGLYNGPSGHPEPKNAGVAPDTFTGYEDEVDRVRGELFDSVLQEIEEEANVPRASLSPPLLMGCMADAAGKPDLLFLVQTSLDVAGVRERYSQGASESWESDRLAFCPLAELGNCPLPMTAVTRAAIACWNAMNATGGGSSQAN